MRLGSGNPTFAEYLTVAEAADMLGVSPWTLRNWDNAGKLKPDRHPVNGYRIYRREDLDALLAAGSMLGKRKGTFAPNLDWSTIGEREHFVQFYETEAYLVESVSGFLGKALLSVDGALMVATPDHRRRIEKKLKARGIDLAAAATRGQYVALDAADTLAKLMHGDSPDPRRFGEAIGHKIARLSQATPRIRAFGEMVALLWEDGKRDAAYRLEALWNELGQQHAFSLFCAYPLSEFSSRADEGPLSDVCGCHSRVIPAESYSTLGTSDEQLRAIIVLQQKAAALEAEIAQRIKRERELADFVENAAEGLHMVGQDNRIIWANKAELELLGYDAEEYIGRCISDFHADRSVIDDILARLKRGETLRDYPAQMRRKDGSVRNVLINSNALFVDGQFVHTRCITRDVTEPRRPELP